MRRRQASIDDLAFRCGGCGQPLSWPPTMTDAELVKCNRCGASAGSLATVKTIAAGFIARADRRRPRVPRGGPLR